MNALETDRLILRDWQPEDVAAFAALNGNPRVMEYLPAVLDRAGSDALLGRIRDHDARHGFALWAVEVKGGPSFVGAIGLLRVPDTLPFHSALELAWRLDAPFWGHGYATEAARRCLEMAFADLGAERVVAYTVPANMRSRAVMERLGLRRVADGDFDHPALPEGHRLRRHALYALTQAEWRQAVSPGSDPRAR